MRQSDRPSAGSEKLQVQAGGHAHTRIVNPEHAARRLRGSTKVPEDHVILKFGAPGRETRHLADASPIAILSTHEPKRYSTGEGLETSSQTKTREARNGNGTVTVTDGT